MPTSLVEMDNPARQNFWVTAVLARSRSSTDVDSGCQKNSFKDVYLRLDNEDATTGVWHVYKDAGLAESAAIISVSLGYKPSQRSIQNLSREHRFLLERALDASCWFRKAAEGAGHGGATAFDGGEVCLDLFSSLHLSNLKQILWNMIPSFALNVLLWTPRSQSKSLTRIFLWT